LVPAAPFVGVRDKRVAIADVIGPPAASSLKAGQRFCRKAISCPFLDSYEPHDVASAQFSLPFSLALRLLKNDNDLSLYMDARLWTDPQVLALARKVKSYADPKAKGDQNYNTTMEIKLTDGRKVEAFQQYPAGSPLNPVSRDELRKKFRKLASAVMPEHRLDEIIAAVERIDEVDNAAAFVPLLVR
jgi:2-methylcitrate dehydratase PrpD